MSEEDVNSLDQEESLISSVKSLQNPKKQIRPSGKPGKIVERKLSSFAKESNETGPGWLISKVPRVRDKRGKFCRTRKSKSHKAAKTYQNINKETLNFDINIEADNGSSVAVSIFVFNLLFACSRFFCMF